MLLCYKFLKKAIAFKQRAAEVKGIRFYRWFVGEQELAAGGGWYANTTVAKQMKLAILFNS